jgi:hypothetical protein
VKVISGDHPATVGAIAGQLGLDGADEPIDARELPEERDELGEVLEAHSVFGRVTPQQKRSMVQALQSRGHTVAMTGDGVNDALALKDADIGVAMGSGSDATRAVAQLVLLDSTFDSLPPVVAEGRRVLGNIERTSGLYLNKTVYAMLISLATGVLGFVFPFLPRHLTLIGAVTIGIPSFFLALAPNTDRFRPGFVRRVLRFAIPTGTLASIAPCSTGSARRRRSGVQTTANGLRGSDCWCDDPLGAADQGEAGPDLDDGGVVHRRAHVGADRGVLRARSAAADRVARRLRHRGDRLVVRPTLFVPGEAPVGPRARDVLIAGGTTDGSRDK